MSRKRTKNSDHAYERAKQRTGMSKRQAKQMMREAQTAGVAVDNLPPGPIKNYIKKKGTHKRVKVYKNHVFVFSKTSTTCITMYPLADWLIKAQREFDSKKGD